jgi:hypothetical protein
MVVTEMRRVSQMRICALAFGSLLALAPLDASAQGSVAARAEALYNEALALADAGRHAEACPKFEASQKLDPALGTQFNLADCYEHVGRTAQALALFDAVDRAARAAGKTGLQVRAHERVAKLAAHVPKVRVVLSRPEPTFELKIDGVAADARAASTDGVPVDPGPHELVVVAPGRLEWKGSVTGQNDRAVEVRVPALADVPLATSEAPARPPAIAATAIALGAAGIATVGVGAVFGVIALSKRSDAIDKCGSDNPKNCQSREAVPLWGDAADAGTVSTITFIAGGALVAAGAVVWLVSAPKQPKTGVSGAVTADAASIVLRGTW